MSERFPCLAAASPAGHHQLRYIDLYPPRHVAMYISTGTLNDGYIGLVACPRLSHSVLPRRPIPYCSVDSAQPAASLSIAASGINTTQGAYWAHFHVELIYPYHSS